MQRGPVKKWGIREVKVFGEGVWIQSGGCRSVKRTETQ